jgi:hypothetical protein
MLRLTRLAGMALLAATCISLGACGGNDEPTSIAGVKECLADKGLRTQGGAHTPDPQDTDAPDRGELITEGAFVTFYSSSNRADQLKSGVRENSKQAGAEVARYGDVTVVYLPDAERDKVEACVDDCPVCAPWDGLPDFRFRLMGGATCPRS